MKNEAILENILTLTPSKDHLPGILKRYWRIYKFKKHSYQNFFATVVALQVLLVALLFLGGVFFIVKTSLNSTGASMLQKFL